MYLRHILRQRKDRKGTTSQASAATGKPDAESLREDVPKKDQKGTTLPASATTGTLGAGTLHEEDLTVLQDSFASQSISSRITVNELSFASSGAQLLGAQPLALFSYKLQKHECDGFGYLQFQAQASCLLQDAPTELAMISGKPIFYIQKDLTDGDVDAGREAFSHPLIVEVLESLFIPVSVRPDKDRPAQQEHRGSRVESKVCTSQAGFLDGYGNNLVPPIPYFKLSQFSVVEAIVEALKANQQVIPKYVLSLAEEMQVHSLAAKNDTKHDRRVVFGLEDLEIAELEFSCLEGVLATRVGLLDRKEEVVEVIYDSRRIFFSALARFALGRLPVCETATISIFCQTNDEMMATRVEAVKIATEQEKSPLVVIELYGSSIFEPNDDRKTALRQTPMRFVPLTELQSTKANRLIHHGRFDEAKHLLSPRQGLILMEATRKGAMYFHDVVGFPILEAWISVSDKERPITRRERESEPDPDSEPALHTA